MDQILKNTVSAENQLKDNQLIAFENSQNSGMRVMFVGNSITLHGMAPQIGWNCIHGMAASSKDKDYVHIMESYIGSRYPDSAFCICQVADWEIQFKSGSKTYPLFAAAQDFAADIIILRFVENCPRDGVDMVLFEKQYGEFVNYLKGKNKNAKVIASTGFWHHVYDDAIRSYATANEIPLVELGDLGEDVAMKAIGLFEHSGVANHPGDLGMKAIAERLIKCLEDNNLI